MTTKSTPAKGASAAPPELRVYRLADGRWAWCYADEAAEVELHSNTDYPTRDAAATAAGQAYPDLPVAAERDTGA